MAGKGIILLNETIALVLGGLGQLITEGLLKTFFSTNQGMVVLLSKQLKSNDCSVGLFES